MAPTAKGRYKIYLGKLEGKSWINYQYFFYKPLQIKPGNCYLEQNKGVMQTQTPNLTFPIFYLYPRRGEGGKTHFYFFRLYKMAVSISLYLHASLLMAYTINIAIQTEIHRYPYQITISLPVALSLNPRKSPWNLFLRICHQVCLLCLLCTCGHLT